MLSIRFFVLSIVSSFFSFISLASPLNSKADCHQLYDNFCKELYTTKRNGNYSLGSGSDLVEVRLGEDELGNDQGWRLYAEAKLTALKRADFPKDLHKNLGKYPSLLLKYLTLKKNYPMSLEQALNKRKLSNEITNLWTEAIELTQIERVEARYPKYYTDHRNKMDPALAVNVAKIRERVQNETNLSIWGHHAAFISILTEFEEVKKEFLIWIEEDSTIASELKQRWKERLSKVQVIAPNSNPNLMMSNCENSNNSNAFYDRNENKIVVCVGFLLSQTTHYPVLAHELAHSLGLEKEANVFLSSLPLVKYNRELIEDICRPKKQMKCPEMWANFDSHFSKYVQQAKMFEIPLRDFRNRLKNPVSSNKSIFDDKGDEVSEYASFVDQQAFLNAQNSIADIANSHGFINSLSPKLMKKVYRDEKNIAQEIQFENPEFANPCFSMHHFAESDYFPNSMLSMKVYFLSAYSCMEGISDEAMRVVSAAKHSQGLAEAFLRTHYRLLRELSTMPQLNRSGYAQNVEERFADALGMKIVARILNKKFPGSTAEIIERKRNFFFVGVSPFCSPKTIQDIYPVWSDAEKSISKEPHSENWVRRKELIRPPLDESLDCKL